jgi:uncharacterized protein (TIGR02246 family)
MAIAADNAIKSTKSPIDQQAKQADKAVEEIRQAATAFANDFNRGDAQAVAAHWTEEGDYVNENGLRFHGREAIREEYADFFALNPGVRIQLTVDSVRLVSENTAVEDGRATIAPLPSGPPAHSRYTAVHLKKDGRWLMSSVRDSRVELPSHHGRLEDLGFLVGTWSAENHGAHVEVTCRWIANKNFLERTTSVREGGHQVSSATQIIGWDPIADQIRSWLFTSDGGHSTGTWTPHDSGWTIETIGVLMDGTLTGAVNVLSRLDDNAVAWRSVNRMKGDIRFPDMEEIVLKRR